MAEDLGRALGWDDEITSDGEFSIIPEGNYPFTVLGYERKRYPGGKKMCACNYAAVQIRIMIQQRIGKHPDRKFFRKCSFERMHLDFQVFFPIQSELGSNNAPLIAHSCDDHLFCSTLCKKERAMHKPKVCTWLRCSLWFGSPS